MITRDSKDFKALINSEEKEIGLYIVQVGWNEKHRNTEQHDILFIVGNGLKNSLTHIHKTIKTNNNISNVHVDAFANIKCVDGYEVKVSTVKPDSSEAEKLYFVNFGGYVSNCFGEQHANGIFAAKSKLAAKSAATKVLTENHNNSTLEKLHCDDIIDLDIIELSQIDNYHISLTPIQDTDKNIIEGYSGFGLI